MRIPLTNETRAMAARIIWFEPPEQALADPVRFIAYAARFAQHSDMQLMRQFVSNAAFSAALKQAPPGIIDPRSWAYWHLMLDEEAPPLPQRAIPDTD